jgi:sec-independent protein translocase protein TatB
VFNVGGGEILVILLIALLVLGPDRLPGAAREVGKHMGQFRRMSQSFQQEMRSAMQDLDTSKPGSGTAKPSSTTVSASNPPVVRPAVPEALPPGSAGGDAGGTPPPGPTFEGPSGSFS